MAYEKIVSVPSTATSGQVPQADGVGGFSWGAVDAYTKAQTLTEATKIAYGLDASAVPDDVFNAVKGLLGGGAKIATGSYVGTGTYGASNPCSLTFDFEPLLLIIKNYAPDAGRSYFMIFVSPSTLASIVRTSGTASGGSQAYCNSVYVTWLNNKVQWYSSSDAEWQGNYSSTERYFYIAIG